jgi:hypothetical protein
MKLSDKEIVRMMSQSKRFDSQYHANYEDIENEKFIFKSFLDDIHK